MPMMPAHSLLRAATVGRHACVDHAFSAYDLSDTCSYRTFLKVHAAALMPLEQILSCKAVSLPSWTPRSTLLAADLSMLGSPVPSPVSIVGDFSAAMLHGVLYVVEGSRLGGSVLAQRVGAGLPKAYLGAVHPKGEWRSFLAAFDAAADAGSSSWLAEAVSGAKFAFDYFSRAAAGAKLTAVNAISATPLRPAR